MTEAALREHLSEGLPPHKVPMFISLSTEPLPRNAAGKVLKRALREAVMFSMPRGR